MSTELTGHYGEEEITEAMNNSGHNERHEEIVHLPVSQKQRDIIDMVASLVKDNGLLSIDEMTVDENKSSAAMLLETAA